MGKDATGTVMNDASGWTSRMLQSFPAYYTIWKDGTNYRAESNIKGGTDYESTSAASVIQNAYDSLPANGGKILLREETFPITTQLVFDSPAIIEGVASGPYIDVLPTCTQLHSNTLGDTDAIIKITGKSVTLRNLTINNWKATGGYGVLLDSNVEYCHCENMDIRAGFGTALRMVGNNYYNRFFNTKLVASATATSYPLHMVSICNDNEFYGLQIAAYTKGIYLESQCGTNYFNGLYINSGYNVATSEYLIDLADQSSRNAFTGVYFDLNSGIPTWYGFRFPSGCDKNFALVLNSESISMTTASDSGANNIIIDRGQIAGNVKQSIEHHTADDTLTVLEAGTIHTNLAAGANIKLTLPQTVTAGTEYEFAVMTAGQQLQIDPGAAGAIYINGAKQADDAYIWADDEGESVKLVADGNGDWIALYTQGSWTVV